MSYPEVDWDSLVVKDGPAYQALKVNGHWWVIFKGVGCPARGLAAFHDFSDAQGLSDVLNGQWVVGAVVA